MKILRIAIVSLLVAAVSAPAFAEGFQSSIAKAIGQPQVRPERAPSPKGYVWAGAVLFAGGMATAFYGFLHNEHTGYPSFGEASATNVKLGSAGLVAAASGGALLFIGQQQSRHSPSVALGPRSVTVSQNLSW
jgi:hypothetical protein